MPRKTTLFGYGSNYSENDVRYFGRFTSKTAFVTAVIAASFGGRTWITDRVSESGNREELAITEGCDGVLFIEKMGKPAVKYQPP